MDTVNTVIKRLGQFVCRYRGTRVAEYITAASDMFTRALGNEKFAMKHNGELRVLKIISTFNPTIIFDVGANIGHWSRVASSMNPSSQIYAFEIVPTTFIKFEDSTRDIENIHRINKGLSDSSGKIKIKVGANSSTATGTDIDNLGPGNDNYDKTVLCETTKASHFMTEQGINAVDFVKIDVEGMDYLVLKGFENRLQNIRAIQFEYGVFNIASRDLLADFFILLNNYGFRVGKIYPRYVDFLEYHPKRENFRGSNFIAVQKGDSDLIDALAAFGEV